MIVTPTLIVMISLPPITLRHPPTKPGITGKGSILLFMGHEARYTNAPQTRASRAQKGNPAIADDDPLGISLILEPAGIQFDGILGNGVDVALHSSTGASAYHPSTPTTTSLKESPTMITPSCLPSSVCKRIPHSKRQVNTLATSTPQLAGSTPCPRVLTQELNQDEIASNTAEVQENSCGAQ
ncbi:hypothetical protein DSO57_1030161 [Entomophthora muscae]|uniref:Uncharacterized protein n=1 Tax=Entomophthora muscae TaxID=34485 RepID=A0ACC2TNA4_9FUNG|nr:hypothetical protein DSO57_1030161 [Entomophthora muscae]